MWKFFIFNRLKTSLFPSVVLRKLYKGLICCDRFWPNIVFVRWKGGRRKNILKMASEVANNGAHENDLNAGDKPAANQARGGKQKIEGELEPLPDYIQHRLKLWEQFKKERDEHLAKMQPQPIKITLPDGSVKDGQSWRTAPIEVKSRAFYACFWYFTNFSKSFCLECRID